MNKIDYGFYEVNLFEGEMNSDWFLKINPKASFEPISDWSNVKGQFDWG